MPELSSAPADASVTGTEKLLSLDFESITVQQVANFPESKGANLASAGTVDLSTATGPFVHITGTTTITALGTMQAGAERVLVFDGVLTLTHNATSLILPTGANITTAAGDAAVFRSEGSGNWRCISYLRADGTALAGSASGTSGVSIVTEAGSFTADPATHQGRDKWTMAGGNVTFNTSEGYTAGEVYNITATAGISLSGTGVTITPPSGGTLALLTDMTISVLMTGATEARVAGQTVPV